MMFSNYYKLLVLNAFEKIRAQNTFVAIYQIQETKEYLE